MTGMSTFLRNAILDAKLNGASFTVTTPHLSLHTGDPGATGASEVTNSGGSTYARQDVSAAFAAAASGSVASNADVDFANMPAAVITHFGLRDDETAGNFLQGRAIRPTPEVKGVFSAEADDDLFTAKAHGLTTNDPVVFNAEGLGVTLPTGVTAETVYYVIASGLTTDVFKVSATLGGATINVTADGNGRFLKVSPKTTNLADTLRFNSGDIVDTII